MNRSVTVRSFAKINLSLNITGVSGNLHTLDMVLTSVDLADVIAVYERGDQEIRVSYSDPGIAVGNDSVTRAVQSLKQSSGKVFGADIHITKNIPLAAGLGGSGVDAAGAIAALNILYQFDDNAVMSAARQAGSDVPYLMSGGFARVQGTGDAVCGFKAPVTLYVVLAKGNGGVLSAEAYVAFDALYADRRACPTDTDALIRALKRGDTDSMFRYLGNALYMSACKLNPSIAETLSALKSAGATASVMTGSGSACVGFFKDFDAAKRAADILSMQGFWARAVMSKAQGIEKITA